jgi:muramidase (phage lysozyme)
LVDFGQRELPRPALAGGADAFANNRERDMADVVAAPFGAPDFEGPEPLSDDAGEAGAPRAVSEQGARLPVVGRGAQTLLGRLAEAEGTDDATAKTHGYESGYDALYYGYRPDAAQKALSGMTLDEVDALQAQMGKHTPVGRYQMVRPTLLGLRGKLGLTGSERFTPDLQDQMARQLMTWRGYDNPRLSPDEVQHRFSQEWASVPTLSGQSIDPRQPIGMSGRAFQQYLAAARAADGIR